MDIFPATEIGDAELALAPPLSLIFALNSSIYAVLIKECVSPIKYEIWSIISLYALSEMQHFMLYGFLLPSRTSLFPTVKITVAAPIDTPCNIIGIVTG